MRDIANKLIALLLSATMLFNVASASSLNDILLQNNTYAGTWEDPTSGMKYYSGGGIKIKFKGNSGNTAPWVKGSVPSYNVGCNGMSIKGGFIALLGLSDIEEQLQDAGAAFAWGLLLALTYSLPAIGNVFQQIQKWARQLQSLLQNMCSIGKNIVDKSGAAKKIKSSIEDSAIYKGFDKIQGVMDDMDESFKEFEEFMTCTTDECKKSITNTVSSFLQDLIGGSVKDAGKNGKGAFAGTAKVKDLGRSEISYIEVSLSDVLSSTSSLVNITKEEILSVKLALLFFGDIVVAEESRSFLHKHFDSSGNLDNEAFQGSSREMITEGTLISEMKYELVAPKEPEIGRIINVLGNGTTDTYYVPNYKVGILQIPDGKDNSAGGTSKTSYLFLLKDIDTSDSTNSNLKLEWGGFFNESLKQIITLLNKNIDGTSSGIFDMPTASAPIVTDKEYVPVLIPQIKEYIQRLRTAVNTKNSLKFSVQQSATKLAQVNTALATFGLINEIASRVKRAALNSTKQDSTFLAYVDEIEKTRDNLMEEIKKDYKDDKDILMLLNRDIDEIENTSKKGTLR